MTSLSNQVNPYIASSYDFSRFETLVDVGGGEGSTLRTILHRYPQLRGVLFDQAETIEQAREYFVREGLEERSNLVVGNFLEAVPEGADAYILKHILEGWKDELAISILRNCRRAMKPQSKILIVEYIVTEEDVLFERLLDLQLMITTTSGCRTEEECKKLFDAAGFAMTDVVKTGTPSHIFEGTPV
jgi:ubiquinone/menaquinone biosynthesis C-methylase UbiE